MTDEIPDPPPGRMVYIRGKRFTCDCGCTVFHDGPLVGGKPTLACNGCNAAYQAIT